MYRMPAFSVVSVFVVLLLLIAASPAAASTITLDDPVVLGTLLSGGSITAGDKLFDQFSYSSTGDMPGAYGVNVIPIMDDAGNFGLRFQGGFVDLYGDGPSDALIAYRVTVTDPMYLIADVHLAGNPAVFGKKYGKAGYKGSKCGWCGPSGVVGVVETFLPDDPFTELVIFDVDPGPRQLVDWALLTSPVQTLHVQKDILAFAKSKGSVATLSFVDQTFSQVAVPEPSSMSMLFLGLAAAWQLRRRSHSQKLRAQRR
jgi:hypothetical protein